MTKLMTALTAAFLLAAPAFAADTMSNTSGDSMKHDTMANGMMAHDTMAMAPDCTKMVDSQAKSECMTKNAAMKKDAMGHDMAQSDSMGHDSMGH